LRATSLREALGALHARHRHPRRALHPLRVHLRGALRTLRMHLHSRRGKATAATAVRSAAATAATMIHDDLAAASAMRPASASVAAVRPCCCRGCDRQRGNARGEKDPGHDNFSFQSAKRTVRPTVPTPKRMELAP
jgi:hypothetical protein